MSATQSNFQMNRPTIIGLLYLASFLVGITSIVGIVLAYIWRGEAHPAWENSHYRFLIRTFWIGIVYAIIATIASAFTLFLFAWLFYGLLAIWFIIRAVRSLVAAQKSQPMADVESWIF